MGNSERVNTMKMIYSIRKEYRFEAAHLLDEGCNEQCSKTIHGHSYRYVVELFAKNLNDQRMVMDFALLDDLAGSFALDHDHSLMLSQNTADNHIESKVPDLAAGVDVRGFSNTRFFEHNPTAEHIAECIAKIVMGRLGTIPQLSTAIGVIGIVVTVWETEKCAASCRVEF
jgi:6-pyruvoyl-tetrahydropterin synthase